MKTKTTGRKPHRPALIAHGGASDIAEKLRQERVEGCRRAAEAGWTVLGRGGSALAAVEVAVRVLEDDPAFDAGRGSVLNAAGEIEMDAMIMDGRDLNFGAVAAVQRVRHPVTLARLVMTECEHAMLAGAGAEIFARERGLPLCPSWELAVEREIARWRSKQGDGDAPASDPPGSAPAGTVGAVALDAEGNLAAATSTGGRFNKRPGRVGDSPLVGCGAHADNRSGAASATGEGEALMRIVISKTVCDLIAQGRTAQEAADAAIALLAERTEGRGGLIVLDRGGGVGVAHNTPHLAHAYVTAEGQLVSGIRVNSATTFAGRRSGSSELAD